MKPILNFDDLTARLATAHGRKRVVVAHPADSHTEYVVERALKEGIADFILVCVEECKPEFEALRAGYADRVEVVIEPTIDDAARRAVAVVREGGADVLMKGSMNTDNLLHAVLNKERGILEPGRVLSHVTVTQIPANEKFPHTLYYEELKRRAAEGRYGDICIGGPMDVKTALDAESGRIKGIASPVVGNADVLIFPNIESGNVFYKTISLFAGADMAGMLCGTTVPVVVASRADSCESKFYSLALACVD